MIELYSGTPGSGKSFHACERIYYTLKLKGHHVIANFPVKMPLGFRQRSDFYFIKNEDLTIDYLIRFAMTKHNARREHETLLVIDEAGIKFNSRKWQDADRLKWLDFFSQHRKFGFDIILISQSDIMLDKQIRSFIEIEVNHRKMVNNGWIGFCLSPVFTFCCIRYWYGIKLRLGCDFLRYSKKIANIYDSFALFDNSLCSGLLVKGGEHA